MKFIALFLLGAACLVWGQDREGNFEIRFEPAAKLQTNVQVPFRITIKDPLHKPLIDAKVTLQIEMKDGTHVQVFPAPATDPGVYIAKPIFPAAGEWSVYVEAHRNGQMSTRTIPFNVAD